MAQYNVIVFICTYCVLSSTLLEFHTIRFDANPMVSSSSGVEVRRLSTPSSVLKNNWEKAFCTEWTWYWCDENGKWIEYSVQVGEKGWESGGGVGIGDA